MANTYIIHDARVVADVEPPKPAGKSIITEVRVADNSTKAKDKNGNKRPPRWVTLKCWGGLATLASKLSKADIIAVTCELELDTYQDKQGQTVTKDVANVLSFKVIKSDSFFEGKAEAPTPPAYAPGDDLPF